MDKNDPTTLRAQERSRLGLPREQNILRTNHLKISHAGSRGVPIDEHIEVLQYANRFSVTAAARHYKWSKSSIYRWILRLDPLQMTGNKPHVILTGLDQFLLAMCFYFYPRSTANEQATFILANGGTEA